LAGNKGSKWKKRDKNRFRKTYGYLRQRKMFEYAGPDPTTIEVGQVSFAGASQGDHTWIESFDSAPYVTAVAVDSSGNHTANVNVYVYAVTTTSVIFRTSQTFTGTVHFHAILIETSAG